MLTLKTVCFFFQQNKTKQKLERNGMRNPMTKNPVWPRTTRVAIEVDLPGGKNRWLHGASKLRNVVVPPLPCSGVMIGVETVPSSYPSSQALSPARRRDYYRLLGGVISLAPSFRRHPASKRATNARSNIYLSKHSPSTSCGWPEQNQKHPCVAAVGP